MNLNPTPPERLLLVLARLHPESTEEDLCTLAGSRAPKYTRAEVRCLVLTGRVVAVHTPGCVTYIVAPGAEVTNGQF